MSNQMANELLFHITCYKGYLEMVFCVFGDLCVSSMICLCFL